MSARTGLFHLGPDQGRVLLRTFREGLAASVGHDLVIEPTRWSARLNLAEDLAASTLTAELDTGSLVVRAGTGGVKPLTDRDMREIAHTARKLLDADRDPRAVYTSSAVTATSETAGVVLGTLILRGVERPLRLQVIRLDGDRYRATAQVPQSAYGVKPYNAFFGALKLRDAVEVEVEVDLSSLVGGGA